MSWLPLMTVVQAAGTADMPSEAAELAHRFKEDHSSLLDAVNRFMMPFRAGQ